MSNKEDERKWYSVGYAGGWYHSLVLIPVLSSADLVTFVDHTNSCRKVDDSLELLFKRCVKDALPKLEPPTKKEKIFGLIPITIRSGERQRYKISADVQKFIQSVGIFHLDLLFGLEDPVLYQGKKAIAMFTSHEEAGSVRLTEAELMDLISKGIPADRIYEMSTDATSEIFSIHSISVSKEALE